MAKEIPLNQGRAAFVDNADYECVKRFRWYSLKGRNTFYAVRHDETRSLIMMHRFILELPRGRKPEVDHRDRNGLNNQRTNLRISTHSQNMGNSRGHNKTGFKGVYKVRDSYQATIRVNYRKICLGYADTPEAAHELYKAAALQYFGDFARFA